MDHALSGPTVSKIFHPEFSEYQLEDVDFYNTLMRCSIDNSKGIKNASDDNETQYFIDKEKNQIKSSKHVFHTKVLSNRDYFKRRSQSSHDPSASEVSDGVYASSSSSNLPKQSSNISFYQAEKKSPSRRSKITHSVCQSFENTDLIHEENEDNNMLLFSPSLYKQHQDIEKSFEKKKQLLQTKQTEDHQKTFLTAKHVRNQLAVWSSLLASRIFMQRLLTASIKLPSQLADIDELLMTQVKKKLCRLLVQFRHLQRFLISRNHEVSLFLKKQKNKNPSSRVVLESSALRSQRIKRRAHLIETNPRYKKEDQVWVYLSHLPKKITEWSFQVADLWHSKIFIPSKSQFKVLNQPPSLYVQRILDFQLPSLLEKVLIEQQSIFHNDLSEHYDDTSFYLSLLRSTLGTNVNVSNNVAAESAAAEAFSKTIKQQDRMKQERQVERRASKGRKIRYTPIPQLLGFMTTDTHFFDQAGLYATEDNPEQKKHLVDVLISSLFQNK